MPRKVSLTILLVASAFASAPARAQTAASAAAPASGLMADIMRDVGFLERKFVALARALPADKYDWRPAPGVRSIGEVLMHVASDNYWFPASLGTPAPQITGITTEFSTTLAFEKRPAPRDSAIAELERSFAFLKKSLAASPDARLGEKVSLFGQQFTVQQAWLMADGHLHEHLGQFIAYARSNGVKPPWSQAP